ncbi:MAG TPA: adenylate/guanylate cyclase domain-containing protein [Polyangiaceae bacterium]|nr:adenylate/guanylate cyclase domain-containing protein [Polyangiaceae bacterium]
MSDIVVERTVECTASAAALWPLLTDTERLNRAIGLGPIALTPNDDATAARYLVKTVSGGFPLEYEERPYEWSAPERFSVRRIVRRGLVSALAHSFALEPGPGGEGTTVRVRVVITPKSALITPIARLQTVRFVAKLAAFVASVDREVAGAASAPAEAHVHADTLDRAAATLLAAVEGDERAAAERLLTLVRTGADQSLDRLRPYALAREWGLPRRAVLGACLAAVSAGVLELTWDLVCPSCRTASERLRALSVLDAHAHCQVCDISYDLDLDRAVEATFRPPASVRLIDEGPYCIGGPARTPHVLTQALLPAGGEIELRAPTQPGRYRLFVRGGPAAILRVAPAAAPGAQPSLHARTGPGSLEPPQADLAVGAPIRVTSAHAGELHLKIERVDFADEAATAHDLSMMPTFRRQFAREVLRPGLTLRIGRVALLFSDLTGSTALYSEVGDALAFALVQDHFDALGAAVGAHGGAVVKTIGDAVMAAFGSEEQAVRAAAAMHASFATLRASRPEATGVALKIGVYAGACYVVTANHTLDYFGQSANLAARLQGEAAAGELVLTEELADAARARGWLPAEAPLEAFEARLKGITRPLRLTRVRLDDPTPGA